MKVILTGSTGFIGSEVLDQCLQSPSITSVVVLSRRQLPATVTDAYPKLKIVIMKDFTVYSEDVLRELVGADACIWSLGKAIVATDEEARKISLDYTLAAAKAFLQTCARSPGRKFRFVYLSGRICERDQSKPLWFMQEHRRIRGQLENELISFASEHQDVFDTYIMKPSMVLAKDAPVLNWVCSSLIATVQVDVLSNAMIEVAVNGNAMQTFENSDINVVGS